MDRRVRNPLVAISLGVLALCLGLAFEAGWGPSADRSASPSPTAPASTGSVTASERETAPETAARTAAEPDALDSAEIPEPEVPEGARGPRPGLVAFAGRFVRPDGEHLTIPRARIVLESASGARVELEVSVAEGFVAPDLAPEAYTVTVEADGFLHRPQRIDLSGEAGRTVSERKPVSERIYLWPAASVAVAVRTTDGRPFAGIADELGLEPKRLLVGAFAAHAKREAPATLDDAADGDLVRFHPPHLYQSWELPGAAVGSLELLAAPPMWIRLDVLGRPLAWRPLAPGDTEVTFTLDSAEIRSRLASLALRVVDPAGAPVTDARVTLRADVSAHRRDDQEGLAPDPGGRLAFELVVPGEYLLAIESSVGLREQRLVLGPGERRDLGDLVLAAAPTVEIRVVDSNGRPAQAWIEIAEHRRGERVDRLYPPMLHRHTGSDGTYALPMPSVASVVLATPFEGHPDSADYHRRSRSVRIDPSSPPAGAVVLTVGDPAELELYVRVPGTVSVVDELDLVLFEETVAEPRKLLARVPPGPCVIRRPATPRDPAFEDRIVLAAGRTTLEVR